MRPEPADGWRKHGGRDGGTGIMEESVVWRDLELQRRWSHCQSSHPIQKEVDKACPVSEQSLKFKQNLDGKEGAEGKQANTWQEQLKGSVSDDF